MNRIKTKKTHSLSKQFSRHLRDAFYILDKDDYSRVNKYLTDVKKTTWEAQVRYKSDWVWKRVRRYVPSPEHLYDRLKTLFDQMGGMTCSKSGEKLFSPLNYKEAANLLEAVKRGYFSDPPGIKLYFKIKSDKDGLPVFRCIRGTNSVEGGVHQKMRRRFGPFNASPEFADCLFVDFRIHHNLNVCCCISPHFKFKSHNCSGWNAKPIWTKI